MNNRPLILRTVIALVVILVFVTAIHPLFQRDYFDTFLGMLRTPNDPVATALVADAQALQEANPQLYQSQVLLQAADTKGVNLYELIDNQEGITDNRDVMSLIRKKASSSIRLGLDLNGGVEFLLQLVPDTPELVDAASAASAQAGADHAEHVKRAQAEFDRYRDVAIEILRKRLEGQKIYEAEIAPSGGDFVALRAPVVTKDEKLKLYNLIKMSAKLNFRLVHPNNAAMVEAYLADPTGFRVPFDYELMTTTDYRSGKAPVQHYYFVSREVAMDGKNVTDAMAVRDQYGQRQIQLRFNQTGASDFGRVTSQNVGRELAIVLDDKLYSAPRINTAIMDGNAVITGSFTEDECKGIADALVGGSFPFQIKITAVFDTDPKLGASNVADGIWVGLLSMVLVAVFMIVYYRLIGSFSVLALALNVVLILGAMAAFDCTLTLPGIAGIVLTIGMAVDANVLVFERIREELNEGKNLRTAVDLGYKRALSAVVDANLTTLITSIILMYVGTGAIKGFAVTLSIGILTSLFTALFVTRLVFDWAFRWFPGWDHITMMQFFKKTTFDFEKFWPKMFVFSAILIVASLVLLGVRGRDVLGVDFTGGTQVSFNYEEQIPSEELEKTLKAAGYDATVTYKFNAASTDGKKLEVLVRGDLTGVDAGSATEISPKDVLGNLLNDAYPTAKLSGGEESSIGGLIGWEFTKAALIAIALSIVAIGVYVSLRYEFVYALSSILALGHDLIVVMGIYLALGRNVSLTVIAALLTVIGYSMNDKVVVFDRIRENVGLEVCREYADTINLSINQTLNRTILTSATTFIVVFVLFLGGGVSINDFVLIMMLGIIVGTYSSIFIAAPLVAWWHTRIERKNNHNLPAEQK